MQEAVASLLNFLPSTILLLLDITGDTAIILRLQHSRIMVMVMGLDMPLHRMLHLKAKPLLQALCSMEDIKVTEHKIPMQVEVTVRVGTAKGAQHRHLEVKEDRVLDPISLEAQFGLSYRIQRADLIITILKQEPASGRNLLSCSE